MEIATAGEPVAPPVTVTVLLVDDNTLFRRGLRMLLAGDGLEVVGEALDGSSAVRLARELRPDVVIMDTEMPIMDGIAATAAITGVPNPPAVLVLAAAATSSPALDAILAGACGVLLKSTDPAQIAAGVRLAAAGHSALSPAVAAMLVTRMRELEATRRMPAPQPAGSALTTRERDVLVLMTEGRENPDIGRALDISPGTVKHHVAAILAKLDVTNRVQAAVEAVRIGLA